MNIGLMLTDSCNYQCKHCMVDSKTDLHLVSDGVLERFYTIVRQNQPSKVSIVGGEPFLFLDKVEEIVGYVRKICGGVSVLVYSNGTFLLDMQKRERVKQLGVQVRISKTDFHKEFWNEEMESIINATPYWKIEGLDGKAVIFPKGRALKNKVYTDCRCPCSLRTGVYKGKPWSDRFLVMLDGSVNIWCPCMSLELANVYEDSKITHALLVDREQRLRKYLKGVNMFHNSMLYMCNEVCGRFKVTDNGIYRGDELMLQF